MRRTIPCFLLLAIGCGPAAVTTPTTPPDTSPATTPSTAGGISTPPGMSPEQQAAFTAALTTVQNDAKAKADKLIAEEKKGFDVVPEADQKVVGEWLRKQEEGKPITAQEDLEVSRIVSRPMAVAVKQNRGARDKKFADVAKEVWLRDPKARTAKGLANVLEGWAKLTSEAQATLHADLLSRKGADDLGTEKRDRIMSVAGREVLTNLTPVP